jgi:hypothetical protein
MNKIYLNLVLVFLTSCGGSSSSSVAGDDLSPEVDSLPGTTTYPGDSWDTYAPEDVNMTQAGILNALDYAFKSTRNTQGVVIIRHGVIVGQQENHLPAPLSALPKNKTLYRRLMFQLQIILRHGQIPTNLKLPSAQYLKCVQG